MKPFTYGQSVRALGVFDLKRPPAQKYFGPLPKLGVNVHLIHWRSNAGWIPMAVPGDSITPYTPERRRGSRRRHV